MKTIPQSYDTGAALNQQQTKLHLRTKAIQRLQARLNLELFRQENRFGFSEADYDTIMAALNLDGSYASIGRVDHLIDELGKLSHPNY